MNFDREIEILTPLVSSLKKTRDLGEKQEILLSHPRLKKMSSEQSLKPFLLHNPDLSTKIALFSLVAIGQEDTLFASPENEPFKEKIRSLLAMLVTLDRFYESIGGIVGYQLKVLQHLATQNATTKNVRYSRAPGLDLAKRSKEVDAVVIEGIRALPEMGEIYPIGGLGSRLDLHSKEGDPLPAACLPFSGYSLLDGLIRDVQAREFLYFRLFGKQVTIPIAMMTSLEKKNSKRIRAICEKNNWFGRPKESFFLFSQLSVPVVSSRGKWVMRAPLEPLLQPGGHGALWRTAEERGVFFWFREQEKHRLLIRQINNPLGGIDHGLLALVGVGKKEKKAFGFASCERLPHAAEGILVMKQHEGNVHLSNIEYTDFEKQGIEDRPAKGGYSPYPANTNILYADIEKLHPVIKKNPLPGLLVNMKNRVQAYAVEGKKEVVSGGRLESMMQNISDALLVKEGESLPTFLTYNERRRTISATKRSFERGKKLMETPEGAFYDLLYNAHALLREFCGVELSDFCSEKTYLEQGPSHIFLYHPALGPLYSLIAQKIRGGKLAEGGEIQCEIADLFLEEVEVEGSLLIRANNVLGDRSHGIIRYSGETGKCILKRVRVKNKGIHREACSEYWKNRIKRHEALTIVLEGHSEFYAEDVTFTGGQTIVVPDKERWTATQDEAGAVTYHRERADWEWRYQVAEDQVVLSRQHLS